MDPARGAVTISPDRGPGPVLTTLARIDILILCTGNTCRSPMAEALLRATLADRGIEARVSSAGR